MSQCVHIIFIVLYDIYLLDLKHTEGVYQNEKLELVYLFGETILMCY